MAFMSTSREQLAKTAPRQALESLRHAAKAYVAYFPGAGYLVDKSFDAIDNVVEEHGSEATAIIMKAYDDMLDVIQKGGNEHKASSAWELVSVTRRLTEELSALGAKAGQHYVVKYDLEQRVDTVKAGVGSVAEKIKSKTPIVIESLKDKVRSKCIV